MGESIVMKFYRVPEKLDQRRLYQIKNGRRINNGLFLIGNELLTEAECRKINAPIDELEAVEIKRTNTYWWFGARFEV